METDQIADRLDNVFDKLCLASYCTKLPTFSGDHGDKGLANFLEQFSEVGEIMGLTEDKLARFLSVHLKGIAKAVFDSFSHAEKQNWHVATAKLRSHFSSDHFLDMVREKLMDMKMLPHESPILFSSRVKRDLSEAYPGFDQERSVSFSK